ncbi:PH domain-containing protein [Halococcus thailandensis]|uniref:YokE-like PH domain-containing protein n=1 Tax=Halococcus thailandensis JCM 13552 TaxID=1227457 RepID=M0MU63_9EURY|nr:PH domain-containing protein [Halococcus thailandensis]EMA49277.1 hypothetical protein C451_19426 [Halococcus thailandensis JCM 13552]
MSLMERVSRYGRLHSSLGKFSRKNRKAIKSMLHGDEEYVTAISSTSGRWLRWRMRKSLKLVLTTERIIMFKRGWLSQRTEDYSLSKITSIGYKKGYSSGKIHLQGSSIDDRYKVMPKAGQKFVTQVRKYIP